MKEPPRDKECIPDGCLDEYFPIPLRISYSIKEERHNLVWPDCADIKENLLPIIDMTSDDTAESNDTAVLSYMNIEDDELEDGVFFFQNLRKGSEAVYQP